MGAWLAGWLSNLSQMLEEQSELWRAEYRRSNDLYEREIELEEKEVK